MLLSLPGRCLLTDHGSFVLFNVYVPNSQGGPRLPFKMRCLSAGNHARPSFSCGLGQLMFHHCFFSDELLHTVFIYTYLHMISYASVCCNHMDFRSAILTLIAHFRLIIWRRPCENSGMRVKSESQYARAATLNCNTSLRAYQF